MRSSPEIGIIPRKLHYFAFNRMFFTYYACTAFNWVPSVTKRNLKIACLFASIPFLTYLCDKRLRLSMHSIVKKKTQVVRAFSK